MRRLAAFLFSLFACAAQAQIQYTWTDITPLNGSVNAVATHVLDANRLVVAGSFQPGRVRYSDDGGRTWKAPDAAAPPSEGLPLGSLFADVTLPGVVYIVESSGSGTSVFDPFGPHAGHLYRSDDFGRSWALARTIAVGESIGPFGNDPLEAGGIYAVYRPAYAGGPCAKVCVTHSDDGGVNWSAPLAAPADASFFVGPTPSAPRRLFAASLTEGAYKSDDGGATWANFAPAFGLRWVRPDPLRSNVLYGGTSFQSQLPGLIYSYLDGSLDGGATWRLLSNVGARFEQLSIDPARPNVLWAAGGIGAFLRSEDRGDTWHGVPYPTGVAPPLAPVVFSPADPNVVYVVQGSRLYRGVPSARPDPVVTEYTYEADRYWSTPLAGETVFMDHRQGPPANVRRTGQRWGAFASKDALAGAVGSCRFWPKPETGLRTRVLVLQGPECEFLRANPGWILEAENEFYAVPPRNGACPAGLVAVHRLPNMKPDLNFRWTADPATIAEMVARGWVDEGPTFCGRPLGSNE